MGCGSSKNAITDQEASTEEVHWAKRIQNTVDVEPVEPVKLAAEDIGYRNFSDEADAECEVICYGKVSPQSNTYTHEVHLPVANSQEPPEVQIIQVPQAKELAQEQVARAEQMSEVRRKLDERKEMQRIQERSSDVSGPSLGPAAFSLTSTVPGPATETGLPGLLDDFEEPVRNSVPDVQEDLLFNSISFDNKTQKAPLDGPPRAFVYKPALQDPTRSKSQTPPPQVRQTQAETTLHDLGVEDTWVTDADADAYCEKSDEDLMDSILGEIEGFDI